MAKVSGQDGKVLLTTAGTITGATGTTTITVTHSSGITGVGNRVLIEGVVGMTDINGEHTVVGVGGGDFDIVIPTTGQTYSSAGTFNRCISITGWSLDINAETIDTTDSSNTTWQSHIATDFVGGSGTFEGFYESGVTDLSGSYPIILRQNGAIYYTGTALITGNSTTIDVPGAEAVKKTYTFTCTDSVVLTTA
ncbi:unnamed protein product [marine sediment metagenome]|uniref:Uncharacterized protein n=1 Tax=marine sediment metagenome TaxID=412755 RepID=X0TS89_9ZZZZ